MKWLYLFFVPALIACCALLDFLAFGGVQCLFSSNGGSEPCRVPYGVPPRFWLDYGVFMTVCHAALLAVSDYLPTAASRSPLEQQPTLQRPQREKRKPAKLLN